MTAVKLSIIRKNKQMWKSKQTSKQMKKKYSAEYLNKMEIKPDAYDKKII